MLPDYHQREFDLRMYLTWRDLAADRSGISRDDRG